MQLPQTGCLNSNWDHAFAIQILLDRHADPLPRGMLPHTRRLSRFCKGRFAVSPTFEVSRETLPRLTVSQLSRETRPRPTVSSTFS